MNYGTPIKTKKVMVYYDDQHGPNSGYVARCTEYEDGEAVGGRIAMDEPLDATDHDEAIREAARHWGVEPAAVKYDAEY